MLAHLFFLLSCLASTCIRGVDALVWVMKAYMRALVIIQETPRGWGGVAGRRNRMPELMKRSSNIM